VDKWAACCPLIHSRNSVLYQFLEVAREITENYLRYLRFRKGLKYYQIGEANDD